MNLACCYLIVIGAARLTPASSSWSFRMGDQLRTKQKRAEIPALLHIRCRLSPRCFPAQRIRFDDLLLFAQACDAGDDHVARLQEDLRIAAASPTPAGVPVAMMSPGISVMKWLR